MGFFRKKAARALSRGSVDPTDNLLFGAVVDPATIRTIEETDPSYWVRRRPDRTGAEAIEENYPEAWRAGRELASARYAERLRGGQPIPRDNQGTLIAGHEGIALQNALSMTLQFDVNAGKLELADIDPTAVLAAITGYSITLRHLFIDHWKS
jgi:hypothetical protein